MAHAQPKPNRQSYRFEGIVTLLSSVSHIGESYGINSKLRREKIIQTDGGVELVPIISGNSLRGILRDAGMGYMLDRIGDPSLTLPQLYFLFSGGSLTKVAGKAIDIEWERKIKSLIPLVAIFGGAAGNHIAPGRLDMGKLIPICEETAHLIPEDVIKTSPQSIWNLLQEESYVRKDDAKDERLIHRLNPAEIKLLADKANEKQERQNTDDDIDREVGQHQQMRYHVETFAAGTLLYWEICLNDVTDLEFQAFVSCLVQFSKNPCIGGKRGTGHGKIKVKFDKWMTIDPHIKTGQEIDMPLGALYHKHLEENRDEIVKIIGELS